MSSLIFGVKGQDGSFLAEQLLEKGELVIGVYRRGSNPNDGRIKHLLQNPNLILVEGDITDSGSIFSLLSKFKPKYIYNLAAQSHVGSSFSQPELTWNITALGHIKLLECVRTLGLDTRIYFAASSEMYGDQYNTMEYTSCGISFKDNLLCYMNEFDKITNEKRSGPYQNEKTRMNPQSPYAIAKLAAFQATKLYRQSYGLFACSGILFNHESERRGEEFVTRKITRWIGKYLANPYKTPPLRLGNLHAKRDWGYAGDYTKAMYAIINHHQPDDFVIGTGKTYSVLDFLTACYSVAGIDISAMPNLLVEDENLKRPSEVPILRAYPLKAKKELGIDYSNTYTTLVEKMVHHDIELAKHEAKI